MSGATGGGLRLGVVGFGILNFCAVGDAVVTIGVGVIVGAGAVGGGTVVVGGGGAVVVVVSGGVVGGVGAGGGAVVVGGGAEGNTNSQRISPPAERNIARTSSTVSASGFAATRKAARRHADATAQGTRTDKTSDFAIPAIPAAVIARTER